MDVSLKWLNSLLEPAGLTADEADEALTSAGFPIEGAETLADGDVRLDVEVTSNRGDVLSHVGTAREVAAVTGRRLVEPAWDEPERSEPVTSMLTLINHEPEVCPLFTAQVIRGVKVGPSPAWLVERLEAVGQRSINNVVDVTNYITMELGHPCHVFDLDKLAGRTLEVRYAHEGEALTTLDGKQRTLKANELVVADAERAQSLAGVIGGEDSEVTEATTNVVLEMATWDPVTVRTAARRLAIRTDASYRFERGVAASEIARAAFRTMALIHEVAGGQVCEGMLEDGRDIDQPIELRLRPKRTQLLLGIELSREQQQALLSRVGVVVRDADDGSLACEPPAYRLDLTREVDLIEEVARLNGLEAIPQADSVGVVVQPPSADERGRRELSALLVGMGFYETVTFSFCSVERAKPWVQRGHRTVAVDDARRGSEPVLRPSVLTGLLSCRKSNQDAQVRVDGGVRLFEFASSFSELDQPGREHIERPVLGLLMDAPAELKRAEAMQLGLRQMRGVCEALVHHLAGHREEVRVEPIADACSGWDARGAGTLLVDGRSIGVFGLLTEALTKAEGLDAPVIAAELDLAALLATRRERSGVEPLPQFPPIERDLTLDVPEASRWSAFEALVEEEMQAEPRLRSVQLAGVYRGKQTGEGRKSVTARLVFRDAEATLRREDVEPAMQRLTERARTALGAEVRG